ncbi:MAG: GntR family transcriptional regulator [Bdellovibrionaceae bacterium]|jgi:uncharacterized protein|nr:GntR family transcriptional regulator [Pseudobdellovibrionaceae bacterium]
MIKLGKFNTLKVLRREEQGFYLEGDEEWGNILLPNKYIPEGLEIDQDIEVFIYFDSEDIIIATTKKPLATVGEFASLKVAQAAEFGIFLDWGLEKDLFVPFREQIFKMEVGQSYVVHIYVDSSNRISASTRLNKYLGRSLAQFKEGQPVDLLLYQTTSMGYKAIIDGSHSGLIFKDDIVNNLRIGQKVEGFIKKIREDGKFDLSLRPLVKAKTDDLSAQIIEKLKEAGGTLDINSKSSAESINAMFNVSRKKFKVALGALYKKKIISTDDSGIQLIK